MTVRDSFFPQVWHKLTTILLDELLHTRTLNVCYDACSWRECQNLALQLGGELNENFHMDRIADIFGYWYDDILVIILFVAMEKTYRLNSRCMVPISLANVLDTVEGEIEISLADLCLTKHVVDA